MGKPAIGLCRCIHLLGVSINIIKENTETLLDASRDVGLEINAEKKKHMMIMSRG
jgi:hypothetical protein